MSLPGSDLFPDLIVLTSPHERSADPIPRIFEVTLKATKKEIWLMVRIIFDAIDDFYHHLYLYCSR